MSKLLAMCMLCALSVVPRISPANIVYNGGFETGDFTGWILSGNPIPGDVDITLPHSGHFAANLFAADTSAYLEQVLATNPGGVYKLTFFLDSDGGTPNQFLAQVDGASLFDQSNITAQSYTQYAFSFTASTALTSLKLGFRNDPGVFHLDDIAVDAIPEPSVISFAIAIGILAVAKRRQHAVRERSRMYGGCQ